MSADLGWIVSQIPDEIDRRTLSALIRRYAVLETRLFSPGPPFEIEVLKLKVEELEAGNRELKEMNTSLQSEISMDRQWEAWANRNVPIHEKLREDYVRLSNRCAELEEGREELQRQVQALLGRCRPANQILYQRS
jgi:hypothetical protein